MCNHGRPLEEGTEYEQAAEFLMDFHAGLDAPDDFEPNKDYTDYAWWLARSADGDWEIVSVGE